MTAYRPRLRSYVRLEDGAVHDSLLGRAMDIEGTAAALAARLDGSADWDAIRAALVAEGHDGDDVDSALRGLYLLHYVEGAGDELAARLERVVEHREQMTFSVLEEARFACQGSGACCSGYTFGPLSDADVERLEQDDVARAFPAIERPFFTEDEGARYLRKRDDDCVFLAPDRKCGIHRALGPEAKPHFCRIYPLESFGTVDGIRVVDRGTCATFGVSARAGLPIVRDLEWIEPLLEPPVLHHPVVILDGRGWDYGLFLRFTTFATELVRARRAGATDTLHGIARCLDALAQVVSSCPLEPGQPDEIVSSVLDLDAAAWLRAPRPDAAARGVAGVIELVTELANAVASALEEGRARAAAPRFREFCVAAEQVTAILDGADLDAPAPELPADVEDALRISLRQQLFGRTILVDCNAGAGLVRVGLIQLFAVALARHDAGARALTAADLSRGHALASRVFQTTALDGIFTSYDGAWRVLLDGVWAATRAAAATR